MILNILNDSIRYTFSKPKTFFKIVLCEIFSVLIIPFLIICGFQYKIIEESLPNMIFEYCELSELNNFRKLLKDGIKVFLVKFIYLLIPLILYLMIISGQISRTIGLIINGILFVVFYTYCFIAIANMIYHNSIKKAFALTEISIVKNNIGILIIIGILTAILFIFYAITTFLDESLLFLGNFINMNTIIFSSLTLRQLLFIIISSMTIHPFIDILTARIIGITYENRGEE